MMPRKWSNNTNLLFIKPRIAPLKETSLSQLQLLAAFISIRSINFITQNLQFEIHWKTLWTDSQYFLHWLKSKKILKAIFQKRINEIQSNKGIEFWHVSIDQNPIDIVSRSSTVKMLQGNGIWWHGPTWIQNDHNDWSTWNGNILSKDAMDAISTRNKGPKILFEVWSLAGEDLSNN